MTRFKTIIAGCGSMAHTWVEYARQRQDTTIVALVDLYPQTAEKMKEKFQLACPIFTTLEDALQQVDANLVFDITIPDAHKDIALAAFAAGCDVLGEKPMASSLEDARIMMEAAQKAGRTYAIMQNRRYLKPIRAFRDIVHSGQIGTPGFATASFFIGAHFGGFRDLMDSPLILDMAIHTFDQARFILQADPVSVYCHEFNPKGSWYQGNAAAVCIFEMSDGSVFTYNGSWCAEGVQTSWEAQWRVMGSLGTAIWDGEQLYAEKVKDPEQQAFQRDLERVEAEDSWQGREGHFGCLDEMFEALIEGRDPETVCTDNIKSMQMVFGALESARTGQRVMLWEQPRA
ncbi:Gfo/Idh/MocA family protein [Deinococcus cellulosilyticus]|uniref:Oxidoreductase n=1 Tax=Deinococcus cellulosilyticus (strain DSM 18568 / NBRC 106333 / KACC 11606 / 5516J-15) TaxID=1223518 RepID=A0A511N2E1_DEIC1|nr:Gfo/Idh/MocA family oxidoreductase [Deinococcus cellulosilyticus]GEM47024.1 oxidoreductase [Deinococcus cellulosilyticus NBRC 106333 = KACC 11606]